MTASTAPAGTLHPSDLNLFHRNPRVGNVPVIASSLRANGQYKPLVVNKGTHTGRPNEVLAGNHTLKAIRDLAEQYPDDDRWQSVLVHVIDVDDDRAARIVAADNRTSEVGTMDDEVLAGLLEDLDGDLDGTGYTDADLEELLNAADETEDDQGGIERAGETGKMLNALDVTVDEPATKVSHGETYRMGKHTLIIAKLLDEHGLWSKYLTDEVMFAPYPEPFITTTDLAQQHPLLMVQPNTYLAGHLIDHHNATHPDSKAEIL